MILIFLVVFSLASSLNSKTTILKLQWFPQAQFAGYIMAYEKGYFSNRNIDLELQFSDGSTSVLEELEAEEIQYCTAWLTEVIANNDNGKFLNITQVLQKSSIMLISRKESNIINPEDLNNKRVRLWGGNFSIPFRTFLNKYNLSINEIPGSYNIDFFLSGGCDATSAMYYNEYNKIYLSGIEWDEMNTINFSEYEDLNYPEDGIYIKREYFEDHSDEIHHFVDAIKEGWNYAKNNQEETIDVILSYCNKWNLKTNRAEQQLMLKKILEAVFLDTDYGLLSQEQYENVQNNLYNQKIINTKIDFNKFYLGAQQ